MKFLLYLWYFSRSVVLRGPLNSILLLRDEYRHEKRFGVRTASIRPSGSDEFFHYQGAAYRVLLKLFKELVQLTGDIHFVDIGCGKGRAVFVAEYCGYNQLSGIELTQDLVEEARANLPLYRFKRPGSAITFIHANALNHQYGNGPAVYFLFNPFNEAVMRRVLERIMNATTAETWIVYMNPLYRQPFLEKKLELVSEFKTCWYREAVIYRIPARP